MIGMRVHSASPDFQLVVDPAHPPERLRRGVFAIGNFDGVHLGHQAVLARTRQIALGRGAPSAVLTFEPHPADYFAGRPVVFRLTPFAEKAAAVQALGLHGMVALSFDAALANLTAEQFVEEILVRSLDIGGVVVGADFHFGKGRAGSPAFLQSAGARFGFDVEILAKVEAEASGLAISSTTIRRALEQGRVEEAARLLGRPYRVSAPIIHGPKLGRTIGVPTANMALEPANRLAYGIYAVRAEVGGQWHDGVASWGVRPTVDNGASRLETFLFDFSGDIYDRKMTVAFVGHIRPEAKFDSLEALKIAIADDMRRARQILAANPFGDSAQIL